MSTPEIPASIDATFDDLRLVLHALPGSDAEATTAALTALGGDTPGEWMSWLAGWQERYPPVLDHARLAVFADGRLPESRPAIEAVVAGNAPIVGASEGIDADLRLYEMITERPGEWTETECCHAVAYGMTTVDDGLDLLVLVTPESEDTRHLAPIIAGPGDLFDRLLLTASAPLAGLAGALLAARMARVPVLVDGPLAGIARHLLQTGLPGGARHVRPVVGSPAADTGALFEMGGETRTADAVARLRGWLGQATGPAA